MGIRTSGIALAAICGFASGVGAQNHDQRLVLQPTSVWVADFKDESCAIRRDFSGGGQDATLELDNFGLGDYFTVSLSSKTLAPISKVPRIRFEPDDSFTNAVAPSINSYSDGSRGIAFGGATIFRGAELEVARNASRANGFSAPWNASKRQERAQQITGLLVTDAFERDILLETGPLGKAMGVLRQCIDDLFSSKGLDPATMSSLSRNPAPIDQMSWAKRTRDDYPRDLWREGLGANVHLRVLVDENGKVVECTTNPGGEDPRFADAACKSAFKYAKFQAARDADGTPTKGFFSTTVIYSTR